MFGVKTENTRETGSTIRCMDMGKFNGLMVESMKDSTKMTKNTDKAHFIGLMEENT